MADETTAMLKWLQTPEDRPDYDTGPCQPYVWDTVFPCKQDAMPCTRLLLAYVPDLITLLQTAAFRTLQAGLVSAWARRIAFHVQLGENDKDAVLAIKALTQSRLQETDLAFPPYVDMQGDAGFETVRARLVALASRIRTEPLEAGVFDVLAFFASLRAKVDNDTQFELLLPPVLDAIDEYSLIEHKRREDAYGTVATISDSSAVNSADQHV